METAQRKEGRSKQRKLNRFDRQLADKIKWYRRNADLTQEELSEKLDRYLTYVGDIEQYKYGVSLPVLYKLARLFKIQVKDLFDF